VHDLVMWDSREDDICEALREVGIRFGSVQAILTDVYGMSNISAVDQKRTGLDILRYFLSRDEDEPDINYWIVTQDEGWVHHFDPE
jgi:hypothetical protein